jgi:hypothetical protein
MLGGIGCHRGARYAVLDAFWQMLLGNDAELLSRFQCYAWVQINREGRDVHPRGSLRLLESSHVACWFPSTLSRVFGTRMIPFHGAWPG